MCVVNGIVDFVITCWYIRDLSAALLRATTSWAGEMTPPLRGGVPCGNEVKNILE
jgi:hypothetical protein